MNGSSDQRKRMRKLSKQPGFAEETNGAFESFKGSDRPFMLALCVDGKELYHLALGKSYLTT